MEGEGMEGCDGWRDERMKSGGDEMQVQMQVR